MEWLLECRNMLCTQYLSRQKRDLDRSTFFSGVHCLHRSVVLESTLYLLLPAIKIGAGNKQRTSLFWFPQVTNFPFKIFRAVTLRPNEMTQREILAGAVAELLWKVQTFFVTFWLRKELKVSQCLSVCLCETKFCQGLSISLRSISLGSLSQHSWLTSQDRRSLKYFVLLFLKYVQNAQIGGGSGAVVAIPEANPVFEAPAKFSIDGLTEKVSLMKKLLLFP